MSYLKYLWIPVLLIIVYTLFFRTPDKKKGKMAPDFSSELIDGSAFSLSDLRGNYVLLDFWGSWCPPCRRDNPGLVKLYNDFSSKKFKNAENLEIVTVALEKDNKRWKAASLTDGFSWKHQIVTISKAVLLSPLAQKYNVSEVPTKFLIDPDGYIIGVNQSYNEIASYLEEQSEQ
ncbi:MAG: TlpA family protein disulfide reductase [Saprospiraceae bacterium]|nr:TlpA family protein disulfide reductase [Saprospiraceae bacterium]